MKKIKFNNIEVIYDENDFSKKRIFKTNFVTYAGSFLVVILFIIVTGFLLSQMSEPLNQFWKILLVISVDVLITCVGIAAVYFAGELISPKHFTFLNWVNRYKSSQLVFGEFDGKYMIKVPYDGGDRIESLNEFIGWESKFVLQEIEVDKNKPLFLTVDCTNENIVLSVHN